MFLLLTACRFIMKREMKMEVNLYKTTYKLPPSD